MKNVGTKRNEKKQNPLPPSLPPALAYRSHLAIPTRLQKPTNVQNNPLKPREPPGQLGIELVERPALRDARVEIVPVGHGADRNLC